MKILVTGRNGQLGSEIERISTTCNPEDQFLFADSKTGDITDLQKLEALVEIFTPDVIINCAAYTAVDTAETDSERAFEVNHKGTENLVKICAATGARLIHISTDYVFNGKATTPYLPNDPVSPLGVYGSSKRKGEEAILESSIKATIIRTSWVYSSIGKNFVKTMLRLGGERSELNVVNDQIGCPTYAKDLAKACLTIAGSTWTYDRKIYHFSNTGAISWYAFATEIMALAQRDCKIHPIPTEAYPTPAERPKYSVLDTQAIQKDFSIEIRSWNEALKECLTEIEHS